MKRKSLVEGRLDRRSFSGPSDRDTVHRWKRWICPFSFVVMTISYCCRILPTGDTFSPSIASSCSSATRYALFGMKCQVFAHDRIGSRDFHPLRFSRVFLPLACRNRYDGCGDLECYAFRYGHVQGGCRFRRGPLHPGTFIKSNAVIRIQTVCSNLPPDSNHTDDERLMRYKHPHI